MTVGQLLFGWAARGTEGANRQQIITASGRLADRGQPATQAILRYCYRPRRPAFGWATHGGVELVFRRSPTGTDAWGRSGAFVVHVLAYRPGTVPRDLLGRLWNAGVWICEPPSGELALEAITDLDELKLGDLPAVDDAATAQALATQLLNAANGRRSSIPGDEAAAVALAARLAALWPDEIAPPSFSTDEADQAHLYDLVAGAPPSNQFAALDGAVADETWAAAAGQLLDAARGDDAAAGAVEAATASAETIGQAAQRLYSSAAVLRTASEGGRVSPEVLDRAASDRRFAVWLVDRAGLGWVAPALLTGDRNAVAVVGAAVESGRGERLGELTAEIAAATPAAATASLLALGEIDGADLEPIVSAAVEEWARSGALPAVSAEDGVAVARLLARHGARPGVAGDALLGTPSLTAAIVGAVGLSVNWRAEAAARNPDRVASATLCELLAFEPGFATALLHHDGPAVRAAVERAILGGDADTARTAAGAAAAAQADREVADGWRWLASTRLPAGERYRAMCYLARDRPHLSQDRAEMWLDAYLDDFAATRGSRLPLGMPPRPRVARSSGRIAAWERFSVALERVRSEASGSTAAGAADRAVRLGSAEDVDVALELTFDACSNAPTEGIWLDAVEQGRRLAGDPPAILVDRLARAAMRAGEYRRTSVALWTVCWIARQLDGGGVDAGSLESSFVAAVGEQLRSAPGREALAGRRKDLGRRGRRWTKKLV